MGDVLDQLQRLELGGVELQELVGWPDSLTEDYLGIEENFQTLGNAVEAPANITTAPATATSTGTKGNIAMDSSYLYVCIATDTWRRVAISVW